MRELFTHRSFRRLLVGQAISGLGDWMGTIALMVLVRDLTGSSTAVGGVLVLRLLPGLVAAPIAARAGLRFGRRRVMLAMDAVRAVMVTGLPLLPWLWWVYGWAFLIEVASLVFLPARDSSVPVLVGTAGEPHEDRQRTEERLGTANALVLGSSYGGIPLGAGLFGLVFLLSHRFELSDHLAYIAVFWVDAATFIASYAAIRGITVADTEDRAEEPSAEAAGFFAGLRLPLIRAVLPGVACVTIGVGALFSVGVSYVDDVLHAGPVQFGLLIAFFGAGACAALGGRVALRGVSAFTQLRTAAAVQGLVITGMSLTTVSVLALIGAFLYGLSGTIALVAGMSLLQERLEGHTRDLAFTAVHVTIRIGLALAALTAGAAADLAPSVRWGLLLAAPQVVLACAGLVVALGSFLVREPEAEHSDSEGPDGHRVRAAPRGGEPVGDPPRPAHGDRGRQALP